MQDSRVREIYAQAYNKIEGWRRDNALMVPVGLLGLMAFAFEGVSVLDYISSKYKKKE